MVKNIDKTMNLSKLCRSCMKESKKRNVKFSGKIINMFEFCTRIEVEINDQLPKHICCQCYSILKSAHTFIKRAHRVNNELKTILRDSQQKLAPEKESSCFKLSSECIKDEILQSLVKPETYCESQEHNDNLFADDNILLSQIKKQITEPTTSKINIIENDVSCVLIKTENELSFDVNAPSLTGNDVVKETIGNEDKNEILYPDHSYIDNIETSELDCKPEIESEPQDGNINLKCAECSKVFSRRGWYKRHIKCAHKASQIRKKEKIELTKNHKQSKKKEDNLEQRKKTSKRSSIHSKYRTKVDDSKLLCKFCSKVFVSYSLRKKHLNEDHSRKTLDGKKIYLCPHCPKTFTKITPMYYHISTFHGDANKYQCKHCEQAFRANHELRCHEWRDHSIGRLVVCDQCDKRFPSKSMLAVHMRSHDGAKPYLCNVCGRGFSISGNLLSHMNTHSDEKRYRCAQCPFRCASAVSLRRHERRHRGERNFQCTQCPKRFYEAAGLILHMRRHTGEKPYRCPYCSQTFIDSAKRRRHFVTKHKMVAAEIPPMTKNGDPIPIDAVPHWTHFNKQKLIV